MTACIVYITAATEEEATRIGEVLVEERLAACVNVHSPITSIYWWDGKAQRDTEIVLIAKTQEETVSRLSARVAEIHSYECPCVVSVPITGGHAPFLEWIEAETGNAKKSAHD